MAVDIGRQGFRQAYRPFRNSDVVGQVRWALARPGAECLPGWSVILNPAMETDPEYEFPGGPVPNQTFRPNKLTAPVGIDGDHYCGTLEDFAQGGLYLPDDPPPVYTADGYLACCAGAKVLRGGAAGGGRADYAVKPPLAYRGGAAAGGQCDYRVYPGPDPTSGGVEVGGSAGDVWYSAGAARGGVEVGGSAGDVFAATDAPAGGVEVGGSAGDVWGTKDGTSGGVEVGGSAGDLYTPPDPPAGGFEVGGEAGDVYDAGPLTGGVDCNHSTIFTAGVSVTVNNVAVGEHWFKVQAPNSGTWHLTGTGTPLTEFINVYTGTCASLHPVLNDFWPTCLTLTLSAGDWVYINFNRSDYLCTVGLFSGACP